MSKEMGLRLRTYPNARTYFDVQHARLTQSGAFDCLLEDTQELTSCINAHFDSGVHDQTKKCKTQFPAGSGKWSCKDEKDEAKTNASIIASHILSLDIALGTTGPFVPRDNATRESLITTTPVSEAIHQVAKRVWKVLKSFVDLQLLDHLASHHLRLRNNEQVIENWAEMHRPSYETTGVPLSMFGWLGISLPRRLTTGERQVYQNLHNSLRD